MTSFVRRRKSYSRASGATVGGARNRVSSPADMGMSAQSHAGIGDLRDPAALGSDRGVPTTCLI